MRSRSSSLIIISIKMLLIFSYNWKCLHGANTHTHPPSLHQEGVSGVICTICILHYQVNGKLKRGPRVWDAEKKSSLKKLTK